MGRLHLTTSVLRWLHYFNHDIWPIFLQHPIDSIVTEVVKEKCTSTNALPNCNVPVPLLVFQPLGHSLTHFPGLPPGPVDNNSLFC